MNVNARKLGLAAATLIVLAVAGWFLFVRVPLLTVEFLQGEWVQDPDFLQHAGEDLDAQKAEIDHWENYELVFKGKQLTGWRNIFEDGTKNMSGWAEGRGASFQSDFELASGKKAMQLRFTDHAKAPAEATLVRDGAKIVVSIGDRKLRIMKGAASNLRARSLLP
jgi:hypothetical protein